MTIPVKLNDLYILKGITPVSQPSNTWLAGLKSISNMFAQSHFDAIMQSLGVNWNTYSRSSILSVIPASSLPQEYGGSFFMMDHASWYQQLKHSSNFSNSVLEFINQDEKRILELYGLSDSGLDVVPTTSMKRTFPRRTTSLGFTASREATAPMLGLLAGSELSHDSLVAPKLEEESVPAAQNPRVIVNLDTSTIHSNDSFTSNDDDRSVLPLNTNDLSDTGDLNDIMSLMDQAILMQQQQQQHEAVKQQPKQLQQPVVSITESPQIIDSQTPSTPPGPPPPPPPPPPPIPSATKKAVPSAVFESISSAPQHKQDIKIVRFKSAVRVHRYEVPPRETWAADVWWTEEDDIGVLEDWEEELYNGGPAKAVEVSGTAVGVAEKDEGATADDSITAAA
ncbi:hypothetical protein BDR26DRAFT_883927 [Obelidium mucronatum]|nr:hypothetical protein BDR26DRAFT_883927 [Obelidium mucronatum]